MQHIQENEIKDILTNRPFLLSLNRLKMRNLIRDEIMDQQDLLNVAAMSAIKMDTSHSNDKHDLSDTYEKYLVNLRDFKRQLESAQKGLIAQRKRINRVWLCFIAQEALIFDILNRLYVKKEKYIYVRDYYSLNHDSFNRLRHEGLRKIKWLYESNISNGQLIQFTTYNGYKNKHYNHTNEKLKQTYLKQIEDEIKTENNYHT